MGKRHGGLVSMLLCAGALACWWLPADSAWHPDDPDGIGGGTTLPPLSAPPPTAGADLPHFGFPLQPTLGFAAPPASGEEGYPFIGSNPTVPLPTGMTDTATVLPMPGTPTTKVVGYAASVRVRISITALAFFFSFHLFLLS